MSSMVKLGKLGKLVSKPNPTDLKGWRGGKSKTRPQSPYNTIIAYIFIVNTPLYILPIFSKTHGIPGVIHGNSHYQANLYFSTPPQQREFNA